MPPAFARYFRPLRPTGRPLWQMLPWWQVMDEGVVLCKQGRALLRTYEIRGHDWHGVPAEILGARMLQASEALRKLDGAYMIHSEAQRRRVEEYAVTPSPYPIVTRIQQERIAQLQTPPGAWESRYFVSLTWTPSLVHRHQATSAHSVSAFVDAADDFMGHLRGALAGMDALDTAAQLTYLASTVSDVWAPVAPPEDETFLDYMLGTTVWQAGSFQDDYDARLGAWHVRFCSLTGYPAQSWAGMMHKLNTLPMGYRWCTRWTKIEEYLHQGLLQEVQRKRLQQEQSGGQMARAWWTGRQERILNESARREVEDLSALRQELGANLKALGRFLTTIMTWGDSADEANSNLRQIIQTLRGEGFVVKHEGAPGTLIPHHTAAWYATHPGTGDHGVRRLMQTSLTAAHLWPGLQAAWPGPTRDAYLNGPPWVLALTDEHTLIRLTNHVRDVGHFLMIGPTGSGKTTLANLLRALWMQYVNAQCVTFDMKRGGRLLTHLLNGSWYDLGAHTFTIHPLRDLRNTTGRSLALHWVLDLLEEYHVQVTGEVMAYVSSNLERLAAAHASPSEWTLTNLSAAMAAHTRGVELRAKGNDIQMALVGLHNQVRTVMQPFTMRREQGELFNYGHIFDTGRDTIDFGHVLTFELESLIEQRRLIGPILRYVYPHVYRRMSTDAPMLLINDDVAIPWAVERIQKQTDDWLRLTRDKAVSMGFLTHSPQDVFDMPIGKALLNCPTRFYLPNPEALGEEVAPVHARMNLTKDAIRLIAMARPQHDVYYKCSEWGERLVQVPLSPMLRDVLARNSAADHRRMDELLAQYGPEGFREAWLRHHGHAKGDV